MFGSVPALVAPIILAGTVYPVYSGGNSDVIVCGVGLAKAVRVVIDQNTGTVNGAVVRIS